MPHSVISESSVKSLEDHIEYCKQSIERIRVIARSKDEEGVKYALEIVRDLKTRAEAQKNVNIRKGTHVSFTRAHGWEKEEGAFQKVLDMFENPRSIVEYYKTQIQMAKNQLEEWKDVDKRK